MYNVLIVDDETLVRSSLASMLDWEAENFRIVGDAANGKAALNILQSQPVDVLFTDIKMPIMDGIELLQRVSALPRRPAAIVVLSAYDEFDLVRQAFRLGVHDYILKSDITPAAIAGILNAIRPNLEKSSHVEQQPFSEQVPIHKTLRQMAFGDMEKAESILPQQWCLGCLEVDDFKTVSLRFGSDLEAALVQPLLQFAEQVPRIRSKCVMTAISFSRFLILFQGEEAVKQARSICMQVQKVWKGYMDISSSGGISATGTHADDFQALLLESYSNITLKYIFGSGGVFTINEERLFDVRAALARREQLKELLNGMRSMNAQLLIDSQQSVFALLHKGTLEQARVLALQIVYNVQMQLLDSGAELWSVFNTEYESDFYQRISQLETTWDVEMWVSGMVSWVAQALEQVQVSANVDLMEKAKRFIADHYAQQELNLAAVAGYVGLNEKYFSTRFNKEVGKSFVGYLAELRVARAKQLIRKTDLKMYEVSEAVGFVTVEHFTRVFKKHTGISPKSYQGNGI